MSCRPQSVAESIREARMRRFASSNPEPPTAQPNNRNSRNMQEEIDAENEARSLALAQSLQNEEGPADYEAANAALIARLQAEGGATAEDQETASRALIAQLQEGAVDYDAIDRTMAQRLQAEAGGDVDYAEIDRRMAEELQVQNGAPVDYEAVDRALAERLAAEGGPEPDYAALDRALAERLEAENSAAGAQDDSDVSDDELRRALAISRGETRMTSAGPSAPQTGRVSPRPQAPSQPQSLAPQPTPSQPAPSQPAPSQPTAAAAPAPAPAAAPRRRPARRNLPLNSRVAAICKLSERVDATTLGDDEKDCMICSGTYGESDDNSEIEYPIRLPGCQHLFGNACIHRWLRENDNCPQCRRDYADELTSNSINPSTEDELFAQAYEASMRREAVIDAEEAGRPPPAPEDVEDPFFAEPSMQELQREEEMNRRAMGGAAPRRYSPSPPPRQRSPQQRQRSPPGARPRSPTRRRASPRRSSPPRATSPTQRRPSPRRQGFGAGRPAHSLSPQGSEYDSSESSDEDDSPYPRGGMPRRFGQDYGFTYGQPPAVYDYGAESEDDDDDDDFDYMGIPPQYHPRNTGGTGGYSPSSYPPRRPQPRPPQYGPSRGYPPGRGGPPPGYGPRPGGPGYGGGGPPLGYGQRPRGPPGYGGPPPSYGQRPPQQYGGMSRQGHPGGSYSGRSPQQYPSQPASTVSTPQGQRPMSAEEIEQFGNMFGIGLNINGGNPRGRRR